MNREDFDPEVFRDDPASTLRFGQFGDQLFPHGLDCGFHVLDAGLNALALVPAARIESQPYGELV